MCDTEEVGSTTFEYDLNGNLIEKDDGSVVTEYEYNDKNGLIGVAVDESTVWQSTYYPDGKRYCKTNTDGSIYYLYDGGKAIGTYDTDWSTRESFGYGLGSRDPIVNTQYYDGQDAFYYVKDGLGNVDMILDADEATEATMGLTACGVPDFTGDYDSDVEFGAGGWVWDEDSEAYVSNYIDPITGEKMGQRYFLGDCGHCITEFGLAPWELIEYPGPGPEPEEPWPPFVSPLPGRPVTLDAGDAGFIPMPDNSDWRHINGIDWVSRVGALIGAIDNLKWPENGNPDEGKGRRNYSEGLTGAGYKLFSARRLPQGYTPPTPLWRGGAPYIGYINYAHSDVAGSENWSKGWLPGGLGHSPMIAKDDPAGTSKVAKTNRLKQDDNLGPHLHLFMTDTKDGTDAAWQERYFPAMREIPLHFYLTAVCLYGWIQAAGFTSYTWDWGTAIAGGRPWCMFGQGDTFFEKDTDGDDIPDSSPSGYSYGKCAKLCHSGVAWGQEQRFPGYRRDDYCKAAHISNDFYDDINYVGCAHCCDERFSEMLIEGFRYANSIGLPLDWTRGEDLTVFDSGPVEEGWLSAGSYQREGYTMEQITNEMAMFAGAYLGIFHSGVNSQCVYEYAGSLGLPEPPPSEQELFAYCDRGATP